MDFSANEQVIVRKKMQNGNLIRFGSIVRIDGESALVHFPIDHTQAVVPLAKLEKTSQRYKGFARVQPSSVMRHTWQGR